MCGSIVRVSEVVDAIFTTTTTTASNRSGRAQAEHVAGLEAEGAGRVAADAARVHGHLIGGGGGGRNGCRIGSGVVDGVEALHDVLGETGRRYEAGEEHVAAQRALQVLAEHETPDERRDAVELGLVAQHGDVDALQVDLLGAQVVEYDGEVARIAVDEERARLVATRRYAAGQERREERVLYGAQRLTRRRELRAAHVQIDYVARERLVGHHLLLVLVSCLYLNATTKNTQQKR